MNIEASLRDSLLGGSPSEKAGHVNLPLATCVGMNLKIMTLISEKPVPQGYIYNYI